jgi:hypothetical protein
VHEWLEDAADRLAAASGIPRERLELSADEIDLLLDLAGHAAHESGTRLNAPLLTHLLGRAAAASGKSVAELAQALGEHGA